MEFSGRILRNTGQYVRYGGGDMRFVVVTGMSGGGKATAIKILEDGGYFDNRAKESSSS